MTKLQFATRLRDLRKQKNLTQVQVSDATKISYSLYEFYENSKSSRLPACRNIIKLAEFFDVSTDYLLCLTDNPKRNK